MWGKIVSSVSNALDFNQATLSGCIDIICVRSTHDNKLRSTPFHVRFGKAKLLRSREKTVTVTVNGELTSLRMKLGAAGEAYFVHEDEGLGDLGDEESASPILSPRSNASGEGSFCRASLASREQDWRGREDDEKERAEDGSQAGHGEDREAACVGNEASADAATREASLPERHPSASPAAEALSPPDDGRRAVIDGKEEPELGATAVSHPVAQSGAEAEQERERLVVGGVGAPAVAPSAAQIDRAFPEDQQLGAGPVTDSRIAAESQAGSASGVSFSLCGHMLTGRVTEEQHDNDVFNANVVSWEAFDNNPALWYHPSLVARFDDKPPYYPGKVALPLLACWLVFNRPLSVESLTRLMNAEVTANLEQPNFSSALSSASRWFFGSRTSAPPPASKSLTLFPYPKAGTESTDERGALGPAGEAPQAGPKAPIVLATNNPIAQATASAAASVAAVEEAAGVRREEGEWKEGSALVNSASFHSELGSSASASCTGCSARRLRRSLRPTPDQLASLNLKPGANSICFTVSSSLQGTKSVMGTIYLWPQYPKIVISDVDGTITRSDVLGQLMPIVGRDWSHDGVAELFTKIKKAGYLILYLTARAIGQADATRDYLFGLTQQQTNKLPDGPLILSPDRLFPSFKREVIERKPYIFKIAALRDIRSLFPPEYNPFYAGFGNRDSDHRAYVHVGVAEAKVFIIDPSGAIHHINNSTYARTYETMSEIADFMFPPLPRPDGRLPSEALIKQEEAEEEQFNSFNFWSLTIVDFPSEEEEEDDSVEGDVFPPRSEPSAIFKDLGVPVSLPELPVSPSAAASAEAAPVAAACAASAAVVALEAAASGRQSAAEEGDEVHEDGERDGAALTSGAQETIETAEQVSIAAALAAAVVKREDEHQFTSEEDSAGYETPQLLFPRGEVEQLRRERDTAQVANDARGTDVMETGSEGPHAEDMAAASGSSEGEQGTENDGARGTPCMGSGPSRETGSIRERTRWGAPASEILLKESTRESDSGSISRASSRRTLPGICDLCGARLGTPGSRRQLSVTERRSSQKGGQAIVERRCQSETSSRKWDEGRPRERLCEACAGRWQCEQAGGISVAEKCRSLQAPQEQPQQKGGDEQNQVTERGRMSVGSVCQQEDEDGDHEPETDDKSKGRGRPVGGTTQADSLGAKEGGVEYDGGSMSCSVPRSEDDGGATPDTGQASQRVWTYVSLDSDGDVRDFSAHSKAPEELFSAAAGDEEVPAESRASATSDEHQQAQALLTAAAFAVDAVNSGDIFLHAKSGARKLQCEKNGESESVAEASANTSDVPREVCLAEKGEASVNRGNRDSENASAGRDLFSRFWGRHADNRPSTPSSSRPVRRSASSFFLPWSPSRTASPLVARSADAGDAIGPRSASFVCSLPLLQSSSSYDSATSSFSSSSEEKTQCPPLASSGSDTSLARRADSEPSIQIAWSAGAREGEGDSKGAHENKTRDGASLLGQPLSTSECGNMPSGSLSHGQEVAPAKLGSLALDGSEADSCVVQVPHEGGRFSEGARQHISGSDTDDSRAAVREEEQGQDAEGEQVVPGTSVTHSRSSSRSKRQLRKQESFRSVDEVGNDDRDGSEKKCSNL